MADPASNPAMDHETAAGEGRAQAERLAQASSVPAVREMHARKVKQGFWPKLRKVIGRIPFAVELISAYYAARDPKTPLAAKATLMAALFYFVLPVDAIPDVFAVFGFVDDGAVLAALVAMVAAHVKEAHRDLARRVLGREDLAAGGDGDPATDAASDPASGRAG